jgi:hypothetical protein
MADLKNPANSRLTQITDFLTMNKTATTIPWDPNSTKFPTRKELPQIPGAPSEAAWVWGDNDYVHSTLELRFGTRADEILDRSSQSPHPNAGRRCRKRDQNWRDREREVRYFDRSRHVANIC